MGTVVTGDDTVHGWTSTSGSALTGKQICHAVYRADFAEQGDSCKLLSPPPLVVVSTGPQPDALELIERPENCLCFKSVPQVDLLRLAKPALFVTNAGQNPFMESLSIGTPLLVCPGFGDQIPNAANAQKLGIGEKVDRPTQSEADIAEVVAAYEAGVSNATRKVLGEPREAFLDKTIDVAAELGQAGGVEKAVHILLAETKKSKP
ncbi:hypothetical protein TrLO_g10347 [Triparma laevis f. longispina]|uniref:Uncharacterized protein n=1 Tax=Triparma laevis f. longispina TaxID=1714387 RepID=A0A9W6ZBI0_9STRA|nr:hypothetical protein TrLO_g10347 [Triparma laevis f. longispina]